MLKRLQSLLKNGFSLRVKGMAVLVFPVAALLAAVIVVLSLERDMHIADEMVRRAVELRASIQEVRNVMVDAQSGMRGWMATGDSLYLAAYEKAVARIEPDLDQLTVVAAAGREPSLRARQIAAAVHEELEVFSRLREARALERHDLLARDQAAMDRLHSLLADLSADVDRLFELAGQTRIQRYQRFAFVALLCAVVGPFGGLMLNMVMTSRIASRVAQVGANAHRLATGRPLEPLPGGGDEIAELGRELEEAATLLGARELGLRASEQRFRELFDQAPVAYHEAGPDGVVQRVNQAECVLFGCAASEIVGKPVWDFVAPEDRDETRKQLIESVRTGVAPPVIEREYVLRDGSRISLASHENLIRNHNGEVTGIRAALLDVTEHRTAVMAARKVEQYAHELRAKNEQLARAAATARAATEAKSRFLANMSHELRTPLNGIIGFSELMYDGKVGPITDDHRDFLNDILTSARHLLALINDILDISKIEAGKFEFRPELCDLSRLVAEVCEVLNPLAQKKSVTLSVESPDSCPARIDPARLKQVLYNYLSNAVKFTADGGSIAVRLLLEPGARFRIEVEDNGPGIDADDLPRLFVEFSQLAASRKEGQGTGLGLALTKRLVEAQGGTVGVKSSLGEGSLFFAVLPLAPETRQVEASRSRVRSVLVIEDDAHDARWLTHILSDAGYAVDTARTREEAATLTGARVFDAITLDLLLPDSSGWDVLHAIRSTGLNRSTPVIIVSVAVDQHLGALFQIQDCLTKPVPPAELLQALERAGAPAHLSREVLVVDDDPTTLRLVQATLASLGYRATCREDGEAALAALSEHRFAVVLLDLMMPGLDGFGFLERLRADVRLPHPPVIVWTNKELSAAERAELQGSARAILSKQDCTPSTLLDHLRTLAD